MPMMNVNDLRNGAHIMLEGDPYPYKVMENEFVKPGKGTAFNRLKLRNIQNNRVLERTMKSNVDVEVADVTTIDLQYLYSDGTNWHFMSPTTYEQFAVGESAMGEAQPWIKEQDLCTAMLWNGSVLSISPPNSVILKIVETDPGARGDTVTGGTKPAKLETGAVVRIPLFIQVGEVIKVDTRTGNYIARAKEE